MTIFYVNGCSHTEGTSEALNGDMSKSWPNQLRDKYDITLKDRSWAGCSNDRIARTTLEGLSDVPIPPDYAVLQWTYSNRFEVPSKEPDEDFEQVLPHTHWASRYKAWQDGNEYSRKIRYFCHSHYNHKIPDRKKVMDRVILNHMLSTQYTLEAYGVDYAYIVWPLLDPQLLAESNVWKRMDKSRIINYNEHDDTVYHMDGVLRSHGYKLSNVKREDGTIDKHYMADGNEWLADQVWEFYKYGKGMKPNHSKYDELLDDMSVHHVYL
tara:strand:- start:5715 stop:6515 length:801 start_codon:yes stop_codon:yes gene_type:complete